jgi:serine/threonine protein kinase
MIERNLYPPYKIVKFIGKGAYGKVYKAYDVNTAKVIVDYLIELARRD